MHINKILSKPLHVEPLNEGEIAEFRLVGADRINPKTGEPMRSAGLTIPGEANITDPHDGGKAKMIQNVISWKSVKKADGSFREEPMIGRVKWGKTNTLKLTASDNETYGFLMRHPRCANNAFTKSNARALFFLVNPKEKAIKIIQDEELALDARVVVRDASVTELNAIAENLKIDASRPAEVVQADLIKRAKAAPLAVINASNDNVMKSKIRIREAVEMNFIAYESAERQWFWSDDEKHPVIVIVPENQNPIKHLMEFVQQEEGRKFYKSLLKKLHAFNN